MELKRTRARAPYPRGPPPAAPGAYGAPPPPPGAFGAPPAPVAYGGGYGAPPPPPGAYGAPPPAAGGPMGPPGVLPPPPMQPAIQGPVVGYAAAQAATPFQVSGPTPAAPAADSDSRVQSTRLYAILFACMVLVIVAVVVAVWLRPGGDDEPVAAAPAAAPAVVTKVEKKPSANQDTGAAEPAPKKPEPKPASTARKSSGTTTAAAPSAPAAPTGTPGAITVRLSDAAAFTSVTVLCPNAFRGKGTFAGGSATVSGVPAGESCSLHFNGGISPGRFNGATAGKTLTCGMVGSGMICK
ncbi:hypothetical protein L6R53_18030 [Myxococcota bacterium]|nr:hypothetical protein [Myxococcota bacterium]